MMKKPNPLFSLLFVTSLLLIGCDSKKNNITTRMKIVKSTPHVDVILSRYKYMEQEIIKKVKTDSLGRSAFEIAITEPEFVGIQIGNRYGQIYLEPGFDMTVAENGNGYQALLNFNGKGSEINNYISYVNASVESIRNLKGVGINRISDDEFIHRSDSLKNLINRFHQAYRDSVDLSADEVELLKTKYKLRFIGIGQEYDFFVRNNEMNKKWEAIKNGKDYMAAEINKELENYIQDIPFDSSYMKYGEYQDALLYYWHTHIRMVADEIIGINGDRHSAPLLSYDLIRKADFPGNVQEFLIALDLNFSLGAFGITSETDSVYHDFKSSFPESNYSPAIDKEYNEWLAVSPGSPAPDFKGTTADGKEVSLSQLKGKIVYIDVWATWCAPCIAEIPFSKKLEKAFDGNPNIEFLNVSIDRDRGAWEKFLKKDAAWKGLHIILSEKEMETFNSTYKLFGVPDYFLIDQKGNIVDMKAPRPSSGKEIEERIQNLLTSL